MRKNYLHLENTIAVTVDGTLMIVDVSTIDLTRGGQYPQYGGKYETCIFFHRAFNPAHRGSVVLEQYGGVTDAFRAHYKLLTEDDRLAAAMADFNKVMDIYESEDDE